MGLIRPVTYLQTEFGSVISSHDPFFEDVNSLWLLHYRLSFIERWVCWNIMSNDVFPKLSKFTRDDIQSKFSFLNSYYTDKMIKKGLHQELTSLLKSYTEEEFRRLLLLDQQNVQFIINQDHAPLDDMTFLAALCLYRENYFPTSPAIEIQSVIHDRNSPGRIFLLQESDARNILERLNIKKHIFLETNADLDQVRFRDDMKSVDVIRKYYLEGRQ